MRFLRRQWGWVCHLPISPNWPPGLARDESHRRFWTRQGAQRDMDEFVDLLREHGPNILARVRFEVCKLGPIKDPYAEA